MARKKEFNPRLPIQKEIVKLYKDRLHDAKVELCYNCKLWDGKICVKDLLPLETSGEECSYFTTSVTQANGILV